MLHRLLRPARAALCVSLGCALASAVIVGCGGEDATESASLDADTAQDAAAEPGAETATDGAAADASTDSAPADAPADASASDAPADGGMSDAALDTVVADSAPDHADDAQDAGPYVPPSKLVCPGAYESHTTTALTGGSELKEASGIVASLRDDGVLWLHNDSGDTARLFAVSQGGAMLGHVVLDGVAAVDWEDISAGPCPDHTGPCLWIADTGNGALTREVLTLYVIPEPDVAELASGDLTVPVPWKLDFRHPADAVDSEAMVVTPDGAGVYLFEKVDGPQARFFRYPAPYDPSVTATLEQVATLSTPGTGVPKGKMITAADIHPSGTRLVLRVYTGIYEYRLGAGQGVADLGQVASTQAVLGPFDEMQGEAVAYDATGAGLWSISEAATLGFAQPLHHYDCSTPGSAP